MSNSPKKRRRGIIYEWLIAFLFFCGVAAITVGLWQLHPSAGMIFLGVALLYLAACCSSVANTPGKDGRK